MAQAGRRRGHDRLRRHRQTPHDSRAPAGRADGSLGPGRVADPRRFRRGRLLRGDRRLQAPGPLARGWAHRDPGGRRGRGKPRGREGAAPGRQHAPQDRERHGRGQSRRLAPRRRPALRAGDRQTPWSQASLGRTAPPPRAPPRPRTGRPARPGEALSDRRSGPVRLHARRADAPRRRGLPPRSHFAGGGGVPGDLPGRRGHAHPRGARARPPVRRSSGAPYGRVRDGPHRARDLGPVRRAGKRPARTARS